MIFHFIQIWIIVTLLDVFLHSDAKSFKNEGEIGKNLDTKETNKLRKLPFRNTCGRNKY